MSNELTLELDLGNGAFSGEDVGPEIARILRNLATILDECSRADIADDRFPGTLSDVNGNKVGMLYVDIEGEDEEEEEEEEEEEDEEDN